MVFLNSALIGLAGLALLPVLIHMIARAKPPMLKFSSLELLQKVSRQTTRARRPKDWLILLLRTLAVLALAFAFLRPLLVSKDAGLLGGEADAVVVVVDRSASMAFPEGATGRFSLAQSEAAGVLEQYGGGTMANVVWIDSAPDSVFPEPGRNKNYLIDQLARARVQSEPGAIGSAIQLGLAQLNAAGGKGHLFVISDFQESAWKGVELPIPPSVKLFKIGVADTTAEPPSNLAVVALRCDPVSPVIGERAQIRARVRNFSPEPRRTTLFFDLDGRRETKELALEPGAEAEVSVATIFEESGLLPIQAGIGEDAFSGDNDRHGVVEVSEPLRLVIEPDVSEGARRFFARCGAALPWLEVGAAISGSADFTVGTGLSDALGARIVIPLGSELERAKDDGWPLQIADEEDVVFDLFRGGEFALPTEVLVTARNQLDPALTEGMKTLLSFADDRAALSLRRGAERSVVIWNVDLESSKWGESAGALPFLGELLLSLRSESDGSDLIALPGSALVWTAPGDADPAGVRLYDHSGEKIGFNSQPNAAGRLFTSETPAEPGGYRWTMEGTPVARIAVPFPTEESSPEVLDAESVGQADAATLASSGQLQAARDGSPLWPLLLAGGFLFLLVEAVISQFSRRVVNS